VRLNRHIGFALILILFGGLILLNKLGMMFGFHHWHPAHYLMGWLIPLAMVALGWYGITRGSKIAWIITILGAIILLGKMSGLFIIVMAVALIAFGVSMLKRGATRV
jgi:lia operon protein LiaI